MSLNPLSKMLIETPVGKLTAVASQQGLCLLSFEQEQAVIHSKLLKTYPHLQFGSFFQETLDITQAWLANYFSKKFSDCRAPRVDLQGSPFAITVWQKLFKVPLGETLSYGALAGQAGAPNAARAIGRIMGQNPIVILFPCHRIIGADNSLTGYGGGLHRKIWLLEHEGFSIP